MVAVSIPISVVGTFLGQALTGRNLNVISMAGLTFAIGMGVDNTIVVLENIFRHREMGKDWLRAAIDGASEVRAILAATLANIAVFLPVVFIEEEAGQLFQDISIAISISLLLYLFVSPTVIPVLATLFLRKMPRVRRERRRADRGRRRRRCSGGSRARSPAPRRGERAVLPPDAVVHLRGGAAAAGGGADRAASVGSVVPDPAGSYLPSGNQNLIFAFVLTPPGYSMGEYREMGERIESVLRPWWEVGLEEGDTEEHRAAKKRSSAQLQGAVGEGPRHRRRAP